MATANTTIEDMDMPTMPPVESPEDEDAREANPMTFGPKRDTTKMLKDMIGVN